MSERRNKETEEQTKQRLEKMKQTELERRQTETVKQSNDRREKIFNGDAHAHHQAIGTVKYFFKIAAHFSTFNAALVKIKIPIVTGMRTFQERFSRL